MARKTMDSELFENDMSLKDAQIEKLESENRQLAEGLLVLKARLEASESEPALDREDGLIGLLHYAWQQPEFRLALLGVIILAWFSLHRIWEVKADIAAGALGLFLFCKWNQAHYRKYGFIQLLLKWSIFGAGFYLAMRFNRWLLIPVTLFTMSRFTERLAALIGNIVESIMSVPILAWIKGWLI